MLRLFFLSCSLTLRTRRFVMLRLFFLSCSLTLRTWKISIPPAPPSCPEDLRVVDVDTGRISLAWEPPKEIPNAYTPVDGYIIEMATGVKDNFMEIDRVDGNTCNFEAAGLKDNKKYNFRIRPYNAAGISNAFVRLDEPVIASPSVGRFS